MEETVDKKMEARTRRRENGYMMIGESEKWGKFVPYLRESSMLMVRALIFKYFMAFPARRSSGRVRRGSRSTNQVT